MRTGKTIAIVVAVGIVSAAPAARAGSISFADFSDTSAWTFNGDASQVGSRIQATPNLYKQVGSAYHTATVTFASDYTFTAHFAFEMPAVGGRFRDIDGWGADGLAFVIHNDDNGPNMLGGPGEFMGLVRGNNNGPFVAVAADTWRGGYHDPVGNTNGNHYEIDSSLQAEHHAMSGPHTSDSTPDNPPRFELAGVIDVWIDYSGATNAMSIFEARGGGTKPLTPILTGTVDLEAIFTSTDLYVGFCGATYNGWSQHDVLELQLTSVPEPAALALLALGGLALIRRRPTV